MREIKFRAWDKKEKKMSYPFGIWESVIFNNEDGIYSYSPNLNLEIMQYTGLKDKNEKEIYERDIVKIQDRNKQRLEVFFDRGCFKVNQKLRGLREQCLDNWHESWFEIIGNIYQNPELLKEAQ